MYSEQNELFSWEQELNLFFFNQIKLLFDTIEADWITWSSLPEIEILKFYAKEGRIYRIAYSGKY